MADIYGTTNKIMNSIKIVYNILKKNYLNAEDMIQLDCEKEFIPLTFDGMFKALFKKDLNLLKDFILSQIGLFVKAYPFYFF